jgi:hypothetical protein
MSQTLNDTLPQSKPTRRDLPITVIAVLQILGSVYRLYHRNYAIGLYLYYSGYEDAKIQIYGSPWPMIALENVQLLLALALGIGLLLRTQWGWWLAGFGYLFEVVQAIYLIAMTIIRKDELLQAGIDFDLQPYAKNLLIFSALLYYLYCSRVLRSFELPPTMRFRFKALGIQFGATIAALIISTALAYLIITNYGAQVPYFSDSPT